MSPALCESRITKHFSISGRNLFVSYRRVLALKAAREHKCSFHSDAIIAALVLLHCRVFSREGSSANSIKTSKEAGRRRRQTLIFMRMFTRAAVRLCVAQPCLSSNIYQRALWGHFYCRSPQCRGVPTMSGPRTRSPQRTRTDTPPL